MEIGENRVDDANRRAIGVEMNGHVWDGSKWVPTSPSLPRNNATTGYPNAPQSGGTAAPTLRLCQQRIPQPSAFTEPQYGYGFTRQTSDDLQFIARFIKIMIIVKIVLLALTIILVPFVFGSVLAAIGGAISHGLR